MSFFPLYCILSFTVNVNGFCPSPGTVGQIFTYAELLRVSWEFASLVQMCFVDLEKASDRVL